MNFLQNGKIEAEFATYLLKKLIFDNIEENYNLKYHYNFEIILDQLFFKTHNMFRLFIP